MYMTCWPWGILGGNVPLIINVCTCDLAYFDVYDLLTLGDFRGNFHGHTELYFDVCIHSD